jgi:hypothetical protein
MCKFFIKINEVLPSNKRPYFYKCNAPGASIRIFTVPIFNSQSPLFDWKWLCESENEWVNGYDTVPFICINCCIMSACEMYAWKQFVSLSTSKWTVNAWLDKKNKSLIKYEFVEVGITSLIAFLNFGWN